MFSFVGKCGTTHHSANVPVLQEDDGVFLPWKKCGRRGGWGWGRQVQTGYYRFVNFSFLSWAYEVTIPQQQGYTTIFNYITKKKFNYNSFVNYKNWEKRDPLGKPYLVHLSITGFWWTDFLSIPVLTTLCTRCTDINSLPRADQYQFTSILFLHFSFFPPCIPVRVLDCCLLMSCPSLAIKSSSFLWHWSVLCLVLLQGDFRARCGVSQAAVYTERVFPLLCATFSLIFNVNAS